MRERQKRLTWETVRTQCLCSLQPYSKRKLKPSDIMTFPWEEGKRKASEDGKDKEMSREEMMARYRSMAKARGLS